MQSRGIHAAHAGLDLLLSRPAVIHNKRDDLAIFSLCRPCCLAASQAKVLRLHGIDRGCAIFHYQYASAYLSDFSVKTEQ
jgi:hypothetical protein